MARATAVGAGRADAVSAERIRTIHGASRGTYGVPRVDAELRAGGRRVGRKRVARLVRADGRAGVSRRKGVRTTRRGGNARPAPDPVGRNFTAARPDRPWVADIACVPTWAGVLCPAVVPDASSRRVAGRAMAAHLRARLVLDALNVAVRRRRPHAVIHHSDQGARYTSLAFGARGRAAGVRPSMGSVGDAYDDAPCESSFATLECELLDRRRSRAPAEARTAAFAFVEGWYNPRRRHPAPGDLSPVAYERRAQAGA